MAHSGGQRAQATKKRIVGFAGNDLLLCAGQGWGWDGTGVQQLICALVCSAGQSRLASHSISKLG